MPGNFRKILLNHVGAAIVAGFFWIIVAKGLGLLLSRWTPKMDNMVSQALPNLFTIGVLLYILAVSLHYVMLSFESSRDAELQAKEARVLAREAELRALKAQINPAFSVQQPEFDQFADNGGCSQSTRHVHPPFPTFFAVH